MIACSRTFFLQLTEAMGRTYSKNEGQEVDKMLHRVATKEREEIKGMTK